MISFLLFQQIAKLFILVLLGWLIVKAGILKSEDSRVLSMLLLYIITPCVTVSSFQLQRTPELTHRMLFSLVSALCMQTVCLLLGRLAQKPFRLDTVELASVIYPNSTNLTIPLVSAIFGPEWVMYVSIFGMVQTVYVWTHGRILLSGKRNISLRDMVCNVNVLSIAVGLLLFAFQITLPSVIGDAFTMAGNTIGPVAMLIVGMLIAGIDLRQLRAYRGIWRPVLLRLVLIPLLLVTAARLSGASGWVSGGETLLLISLFSAMAPSANIVPQFCQMFGRDALYASLINAVTMLLCIATMPLMVLYFQM